MPVVLGAVAVEGAGDLLLGGAAVEGAEALGVGAAATTTEAATAGGIAAAGTEAAAGTAEALTAAQQAARLQKALEVAKTLAKAAAASQACKTCCKRLIVISRAASPKSADHIDQAQAQGYPSTLTYDPAGKNARRAASLKGIPTKTGFDRDEYPPAAFAENAGAASVQYVPSGDNRSAGGQISAQLNGATPGCSVTIKTGP